MPRKGTVSMAQQSGTRQLVQAASARPRAGEAWSPTGVPRSRPFPKAPGSNAHINVLLGHAMSLKGLHRALEQPLGDKAVEFGDDHRVARALSCHHRPTVGSASNATGAAESCPGVRSCKVETGPAAMDMTFGLGDNLPSCRRDLLKSIVCLPAAKVEMEATSGWIAACWAIGREVTGTDNWRREKPAALGAIWA